MKKSIIKVILFSLLFAGCGVEYSKLPPPKPIPGIPCPTPSPTPIPVVTPSTSPSPSPNPTPIPSPSPTPTVDPYVNAESIVNSYNEYRNAIGQESLVPGLSCTLYTVPQTTALIVGATLTNVGSFGFNGNFNQPDTSVSVGLNILPTALQQVYQTWFIVKCSGYIVSQNSEFYEFSLTSDDGSNMYIDGGLLINNDGLHAAQSVNGAKFLQANVHSFELDFLQATGYQELILDMNGSAIPGQLFYH